MIKLKEYKMDDISFHLTDDCNIRCKECHWFSDKIMNSGYIPYNVYIDWINNNIQQIKRIRLTGGEPTMYKDFVNLVNNIPDKIWIRVNSNGLNIDKLSQIKNRNKLELVISINRPITSEFKQKILDLEIYETRFVTFHGDNPDMTNEVTNAKQFELQNIENKKCKCRSKLIRFGSDGYAYNCEIGLRTKNPNLRTGLSLWNNNFCDNINCAITKNCYSNFVSENKFELLK
jgi:uncharacterized radical SAM superfamily Fe-S cluster-containing enzyme